MQRDRYNKEKQQITCDPSCKFFRCSEKKMKVVRERGKKVIYCQMVDGDICIGYKCKFAVCSMRPPALNIQTGECSVKKKRYQPTQPKQKVLSIKKRAPTPIYYNDDPMDYSKFLNKRMRKNLKAKDFYD